MNKQKNTHKMYKNGRVFIIRPFKIKSNRKNEVIDFDKVDNELISPCIEELGLTGGTTVEFVQQGNIRVDMFRELLAADIVIADISIHNANVFYELGIRHALRDRATVLIKADKHTDPGIFDLSTDRYLSYNLDNPSASIRDLTKVIKNTLDDENKDSPVFYLLPGLTSVDPDKVIIVPLKFREEVEQYKDKKQQLVELRLKAIDQPWETQGLRLIGNAQYRISDYLEAIYTWERIRQFNANDVEANQRLATCYQKTGQYLLSEQAASRALNGESDWGRAKTHALIGSNIKTRWRQSWEPIKKVKKRQADALCSPLLQKSYEAYRTGFEQHRNHYYSGLGAIAMLQIQLQLAKLHPDKWILSFDSDARAEFDIEERKNTLVKMIAATELAIETSIKNYDADWARISKADLMLLNCSDVEKVKHEYKMCMDVISGVKVDVISNQLKLYRDLGLFTEHIACLTELLNLKES